MQLSSGDVDCAGLDLVEEFVCVHVDQFYVNWGGGDVCDSFLQIHIPSAFLSDCGAPARLNLSVLLAIATLTHSGRSDMCFVLTVIESSRNTAK